MIIAAAAAADDNHVVVVASHSLWRTAIPLPAGLQNSHQNGGRVFLIFVADPTTTRLYRTLKVSGNWLATLRSAGNSVGHSSSARHGVSPARVKLHVHPRWALARPYSDAGRDAATRRRLSCQAVRFRARSSRFPTWRTVSPDYTAHTNRFIGKISWVQIDLGEDAADNSGSGPTARGATVTVASTIRRSSRPPSTNNRWSSAFVTRTSGSMGKAGDPIPSFVPRVAWIRLG
jgi:hypothetical protein